MTDYMLLNVTMTDEVIRCTIYDYNRYPGDRKTTSGSVILLTKGALSWKS